MQPHLPICVIPSLLVTIHALSFGQILPHLAPRQIETTPCIPPSHNNPLQDDVPAIHAALEKCGYMGVIILPENTTYQIRSPVSLTACQSCDVQVNGNLNISSSATYWRQAGPVFNVKDVRAAIIRSLDNTGVIEDHRFASAAPGGEERNNYPATMPDPPLFEVTNTSWTLFSQLRIHSPHGVVFNATGSTSHALIFNTLSIDGGNTRTQTPAHTAFHIDRAQDIRIWNATLTASSTCVHIRPGSTHIQVEESACTILSTPSTGEEASGIKLDLSSPGSIPRSIKDVFVRQLRAHGRDMVVINMQVIPPSPPPTTPRTHRNEGLPWSERATATIHNATFTDVTVSGPVKQAAVLTVCKESWCAKSAEWNPLLNLTDITLQNFNGEAEMKSQVVCTNAMDVCGVKVENWNVTKGIEYGGTGN